MGELRFRNPLEHEGWKSSGVRDAASHGSHCPNDGIAGIGSGGDEDCLFLNVYTPNLSSNGNLSVMFWIHGGAFVVRNLEVTLIKVSNKILNLLDRRWKHISLWSRFITSRECCRCYDKLQIIFARIFKHWR